MNVPPHLPSQDPDNDRKSRLTTQHPIEVQSLRERAASQPPRSVGLDMPSSPLEGKFDAYNSSTGIPWSHNPSLGTQHPRFVPLSRSASLGVPQSVPTRSSSFSYDRGFQPSSTYAAGRVPLFSSTFEDDESEVTSDDLSQSNYDSVSDLSQLYRGRAYSPDNYRSRSQSLAGLRTTSSSLINPTPTFPQSWKETNLTGPTSLNPQSLGSSRPSVGRYGSYGNMHNFPLATSPLRAPSRDANDISNISPFLRGVNQILVDDRPFRELWGESALPRDETWIPGSGTTSRRHSVSVIQPRRGTLPLSSSIDVPHPDPVAANTKLAQQLDPVSVPERDLTMGLNRLHLNFQNEATALHLSQTMPRSAGGYSPQIEGIGGDHSEITTRQTIMNSTAVSHKTSGHGFNSQQEWNQNLSYLREPNLHSSEPIGTKPSLDTARSRGPVDSGPLSPSVLSPTSGTSIRSVGNGYRSDVQNGGSGSFRSGQSDLSSSELGKGVPLHALPASFPLYIVEFKAGRTDLFYSPDSSLRFSVGDLVIVEADRGKDLGKVVNDSITHAELEEWQSAARLSDNEPSSPGGSTVKKELNPKKIYGNASTHDMQLLIAKAQDEEKALQLCQSKVKQKKLPMDVIDAEYQWDRRKLTFYFVADKRIDFRELVRELFRLYKTRIWMASLSQTSNAIE